MHPDNPNESAAVLSPDDPVLSVVIPVYGCQPCLRDLHKRLSATAGEMGISYEIVLVDDRSEDGAWAEIERLAAVDGSVRGVLLSRNFGQHAATTAGLQYARGDWVVVMDCDLQDPPEVVPRLYEKALEGYDVVFARRPYKPASPTRRALSRLYFWAIGFFGEHPIKGQYGSYSIISRKVVDAFLVFRDQDRHYMMILAWMGFATGAVDYTPVRRPHGRSSYSLPHLLRVALDGVFFQTTVLLRWIVYLGFCLAAVGGLLAVYILIARITGSAYPGWTTIVTAILSLGGFIILSNGITGLYIGKVFDQTRARPVFVVDRVADRVSAGYRHSQPGPRRSHCPGLRSSDSLVDRAAHTARSSDGSASQVEIL
jgi:glycosyltransferase involved in cell wall biosynthesis